MDNQEPIGATYDEAEEYEDWEPVDFQRWYYGKNQFDEMDDKYMMSDIDAYEEWRLSIDD